MEIYNIQNDIKVVCETAVTFPDGIKDAFHKLMSELELNEKRSWFGISYPDEKNKIKYKAAAEILSPDDESDSTLETFIIKKGAYISIYIADFMDNISSIEKAFRELLTYKNIDPEGYCLEQYINGKDVRCMIGITE